MPTKLMPIVNISTVRLTPCMPSYLFYTVASSAKFHTSTAMLDNPDELPKNTVFRIYTPMGRALL